MGIPEPTGPFPVGCCDIMTKANNIPVDVQPNWLCAQYTDLGVFTTLYYPCRTDLDKTKFEKASWVPALHKNWYCNGVATNNLKTSWFSFVIKYCQSGITQNAFCNAPLIDQSSWQAHVTNDVIKQHDGDFPVIIFSHGLSACRSFYSGFCTELASQGFVVAAIEHRDGSSCSSFFIDKNGKHVQVPYFYTDIEDDGDEVKFRLRNMQLLKRSKELSKLMDLLELLNQAPLNVRNLLDSKNILALFPNRLALKNPILIGHSFGAATCLDALHKDPRFKCGVLLDLWTVPLGPELYCKMETNRPMLIIMTECWKWEKNCDRLKTYSDYQREGCIETVTLKNAGHLDQTDSTPIIPKTLAWVFGKDLGPIDYVQGIQLQRKLIMEYCTKFLGKCLSEDAAGDNGATSKEDVLVNLLTDVDFTLNEEFISGYSM